MKTFETVSKIITIAIIFSWLIALTFIIRDIDDRLTAQENVTVVQSGIYTTGDASSFYPVMIPKTTSKVTQPSTTGVSVPQQNTLTQDQKDALELQAWIKANNIDTRWTFTTPNGDKILGRCSLLKPIYDSYNDVAPGCEGGAPKGQK